MTEQLHFPDIEANYIQDFAARVDKAKQDYVVLDQTAFYPTGGGQDHDTGKLFHGEGELVVKDVIKKGPDVRHIIEGDLPADITKVTGAVDWDRRFAHMRMHTAQHLVSGLVYDLFGGARTVGNQIHTSRSRIDFGIDDFSQTDLAQIEEDANQIIASQRPISAYEEARASLMERVKPERSNLDLIPAKIERLRVIEIKDFDICPCAGTHVRDTKEIGRLTVLGTRSKGKDKTRLEFTLEGLEPDDA